jgi:hypothetical protein
MVNVFPEICNLCGGKVIYTTNDKIYGRRYGSGYCYLCTNCRAYVGTHKPRPKEAFGILANEEMRNLKKLCHSIFDNLWKTPQERITKYKLLAQKMGIEEKNCHFGYFDLYLLNKAYEILKNKEI